jgi:hypothetical protein
VKKNVHTDGVDDARLAAGIRGFMDFHDFGWLADIANKRAVRDGKTKVPDRDLSRLLARGLVERQGTTVCLTKKGEIALAKLS